MPEDKGRIARLNEKLYSRTRYEEPEDARSTIHPNERAEVEEKFNSPDLDSMLRFERSEPPRKSWTKIFFIFALVFFFLAAAAAAYVYFGGKNFISSKNVDIAVNAPVTIAAGDLLSLGITITNSNNADLETADLSITYPDGARNPANQSVPLIYQDASLGVINAGEAYSTTTSVIFFGSKGDTEDINLTLNYTVKGSNATFSKQKVFEVSLGTTPVTLTVSQPQSVTSGDTFTTTVDLVSNSTDVLKDVVIQGEYPYGFAVTDTSPAADNQASNLWNIGDLAPGAKKTITVQGVLSGQDGEQRTFRFLSGVGQNGGTDHPDNLATVENTIDISRPDLDLSVKLNGDDSATYSAPAGQIINGTIHYQNNLPDNIQNGMIVVSLSGQALDKFSVKTQGGGFYDSVQNTITWNPSNTSNLASLAPGATGDLNFQFSSLSNLPANAANQEIDLGTIFSGAPVGGQALQVADTHSVKLGSQVTLGASSLYSKGPFANTGAIPPKAEKPTTYTVALTLKDTQNDIMNPQITATLGSNVTWNNQTSVGSGNISYNDSTHTVTWNDVKLLSGTGFSLPTQTIYFQVSLTPSIGQIGSPALLISNIAFSGQDVFTNQPVQLTAPAVTTLFDSDPKFVQGDENVVK
jgi:Domain of unknown function DUF11